MYKFRSLFWNRNVVHTHFVFYVRKYANQGPTNIVLNGCHSDDFFSERFLRIPIVYCTCVCATDIWGNTVYIRIPLFFSPSGHSNFPGPLHHPGPAPYGPVLWPPGQPLNPGPWLGQQLLSLATPGQAWTEVQLDLLGLHRLFLTRRRRPRWQPQLP